MSDPAPHRSAARKACPHCLEWRSAAAPLCESCGRPDGEVPDDPQARRRLLRAFHALVDRVESAAFDAREVSGRVDRLLAEGYLPDDPALLLAEAEHCMRRVNGTAGYSTGWGLRYQSCISAYERLPAPEPPPPPPPPPSHLRRLLRFSLVAPVRLAIPALALLIRSLLRARRAARRVAAARTPAPARA